MTGQVFLDCGFGPCQQNCSPGEFTVSDQSKRGELLCIGESEQIIWGSILASLIPEGFQRSGRQQSGIQLGDGFYGVVGFACFYAYFVPQRAS